MYLHKFISKFQYKVDKKDFGMSFKTHPKYPNIIAMSETFEQYGIDSVLVQVPKERLRELPDDFVAVLNIDNVSKTVFVHKKEKAPLQIRTIENKTTSYSDLEFLRLWTGIALGINPNPDPIAKSVHPLLKLQNIYYAILFTGLLVGFFALMKNHILSLSGLGYFVLASGAAYLSYLILKEKLGLNGGLNRFCSTFKQTNCNDVLKKGNDQLFLNISFTDLAISYAVFSVVISFFITQFHLSSALFVFTTFSMPILLYSVYSQVIILKKLCPVCLSLASIVLLQLLVLGFSIDFNIQWDFQGILSLGFIMGMITSVWMLLQDKLSYLEEMQSSSLDFHQLIREHDMYKTLQQDYESDHCDFEKVQPVLLTENRNENTNTIHLILSPNCSGCTTAYQDLKKLMSYHANQLEVGLIFDLRSSSEMVKTVFSRIAEMTVEDGIMEALDDWFIEKKLEKQWLQKWGTDQGSAKEVLNTHHTFLQEEKIFQTPMIFFNHTELSNFYRLKDLVYFMKLT